MSRYRVKSFFYVQEGIKLFRVQAFTIQKHRAHLFGDSNLVDSGVVFPEAKLTGMQVVSSIYNSG